MAIVEYIVSSTAIQSRESRMRRIRLLASFVFLFIAFASSWPALYGQSGFDDDRVMLQGF